MAIYKYYLWKQLRIYRKRSFYAACDETVTTENFMSFQVIYDNFWYSDPEDPISYTPPNPLYWVLVDDTIFWADSPGYPFVEQQGGFLVENRDEAPHPLLEGIDSTDCRYTPAIWVVSYSKPGVWAHQYGENPNPPKPGPVTPMVTIEILFMQGLGMPTGKIFENLGLSIEPGDKE